MRTTPNHTIRDLQVLRALLPARDDTALSVQKVMPGLDRHARTFIGKSPFLSIGTQNVAGKADVSPRGDPPGFVRILDDRTLAIPERPGNNRLDSLMNILENPNVGLLFVIPGYDDTLRVNGQAHLSTDPDLLQAMAVHDRPALLAIVVQIKTAFLHCAKAFRRSNLWDPDHLQDRSDMPSLMKMIHDQTEGAPDNPDDMRKLDDALEQSYEQTMY